MNREEENRMAEIRAKLENHYSFETAPNSLSDENYDLLVKKSVAYQGVSEEFVEEYIDNTAFVVSEVQQNFINSLIDQIDRAEMIINDISDGFLDSHDHDAESFEDVIRCINLESVDKHEADEKIDQIAVQMGTVFKRISSFEGPDAGEDFSVEIDGGFTGADGLSFEDEEGGVGF